MEAVERKKGEYIARQQDKVRAWYIIQRGVVLQKNAFVEARMQQGGIIGILEQDWFICDYVAESDVTLFMFPCESVDDLHIFFLAEQKMRSFFLRSAMMQRHQQFVLYQKWVNRVQKFQRQLGVFYNEYKAVCGRLHMEAETIYGLEHFEPLVMKHRVQNWELKQSNSLIQFYLDDYLKLFDQDENMCIGAIMEASAQMHRVILGIEEVVEFLRYQKDDLFSDKQQSLYQAFWSLYLSIQDNDKEVSAVTKKLGEILDFAKQMEIYDQNLLNESRLSLDAALQRVEETTDRPGEKGWRPASDLEFLLAFSNLEQKEQLVVMKLLEEFKGSMNLPGSDERAYQLRKQMTKTFYKVYTGCLKAAITLELEEKRQVPPTVLLFLNFGYMDSSLLGEEKTEDLYHLVAHLDLCRSEHVFTMYEWLKAVYLGKREPSKNEFDLDYAGTLAEALKQREITKEEFGIKSRDQEAKLMFELENMFPSVNRITYGSITSFCPILREDDVMGMPQRLLVTTAKIEAFFNELRMIDYSVFYRPILNHGLGGDMRHEALMQEILPDVVLMPNGGSRAMMWQETASVRNDTPARFMLPILFGGDLKEQLLEITGRFRWEICRKIQGIHWNDIRDRSLTSEYYDYLQFYRKNHELSGDTKQQIKNALTRAKNNFREVFVRDYLNYIKYEARGGFRLNRYARRIMFTYCPLSKGKCQELKANPMFSEVISRHETMQARDAKRIQGLYDKYAREVGEITPAMKVHRDYYLQ